MQQPLDNLTHAVAELLSSRQMKIVLAESCTAGLISATLARVPGASKFHCGSAVVYRLKTKTRWLGIPASILTDPGPVSELVAREMAEGVLTRTPEADLAAAITGHLGPNAPPEQDGLVFIGIAVRGRFCRVIEHRLPRFGDAHESVRFPGETEREQRQWAATELVLTEVAAILRSADCDP